jgi:hypothetical protein
MVPFMDFLAGPRPALYVTESQEVVEVVVVGVEGPVPF